MSSIHHPFLSYLFPRTSPGTPYPPAPYQAEGVPVYYPLSAFVAPPTPATMELGGLVLGTSWSPPTVWRKLTYYKKFLEATYRDIAFAEDVMLYDSSSSVVRRQQEKASAITSIIDQLSVLQPSDRASLWRDTLDAERRLLEFGDAFSLYHELAHTFYSEVEEHQVTAWKEKVRLSRDLLLRGRMLRRFFRRIRRDIRRFFRTLIRMLFMHQNDQSGNDEFLVFALFYSPTIHLLQNWSRNGQTRNYSADRTDHRRSSYEK
jgi:hypothetical protein